MTSMNKQGLAIKKGQGVSGKRQGGFANGRALVDEGRAPRPSEKV